MRSLFHAMFALAVATHTLDAQTAGTDARSTLDSIVLERTSCLGTCPAYRLSVRADGFVRFVSRNQADNGRTESQRRGRDVMRRIERELERAHFSTLPEMRMGRLPYCRTVMSDSPTITLSTFSSRDTRTVSYYTGCVGEGMQDTMPRQFIRRLRVLADSIDSIAAGKGWIRPARRY